MLLPLMILFPILTFVSSGESENSKIFLYSAEEDNLIGYENAKNSLLRNLQSFTCVDDATSCSSFGKCNEQKNGCECDSSHTTYPAESNPQCNYTRKKQLVAFLCELFLGFGAGHFYTERYGMAAAKLSCFLFGIYIICLFPITTKCINDKCENDCMVISVACFYYYCVLGLAFWFIYDLVMFGTNKYADGNDIPLQPWGSN